MHCFAYWYILKAEKINNILLVQLYFVYLLGNNQLIVLNY